MATIFSCRTEEDFTLDTSSNAGLKADTDLANLMRRVVLKDGSADNIIDGASNLTVQLPITVIVNGTQIEINSVADYKAIEIIFDESDTDTDTLEINFPITVIRPDFTTTTVSSNAQLQGLAMVENTVDDDIECIDFEYPISISVFDEITEMINTITINNDKEMFGFIQNLRNYAAATINFPINVTYANGERISINNTQDLRDAIADQIDVCDEDDNNNFNDCNVNFLSASDVNRAFSDCQIWTVDLLIRNRRVLFMDYVDFNFEFNGDGSITVTENGNTYAGTWQAVGPDGNVELTISIPDLPDLNNTWNVCRIIRMAREKQLEVRLGMDRLRFGSFCN